MYLYNFLLLSIFLLFFLSLTLTHAILQVHRSSHSETSLFFPRQHLMAEWPHLFLHLFLPFFLPHVSHQVTVNASTKALTFVHDISEKDEFNSPLCPLAEWPRFFFSQFFFFLQRVPHA